MVKHPYDRQDFIRPSVTLDMDTIGEEILICIHRKQNIMYGIVSFKKLSHSLWGCFGLALSGDGRWSRYKFVLRVFPVIGSIRWVLNLLIAFPSGWKEINIAEEEVSAVIITKLIISVVLTYYLIIFPYIERKGCCVKTYKKNWSRASQAPVLRVSYDQNEFSIVLKYTKHLCPPN